MRDGVPIAFTPNGGVWCSCGDACEEHAKVFLDIERIAEWSFYDDTV